MSGFHLTCYVIGGVAFFLGCLILYSASWKLGWFMALEVRSASEEVKKDLRRDARIARYLIGGGFSLIVMGYLLTLLAGLATAL